MDAFVISSLLSRLMETLQTAGPPRSMGVTPLHRYYGPDRHPLAFDRLLGWSGYTIYLAPMISHRDEEGFASYVACPCHRAVASTPPRWDCRVGQLSAAHSAFALTVVGSALGSTPFRGRPV